MSIGLSWSYLVLIAKVFVFAKTLTVLGHVVIIVY